jgi:hypothetical protein
MKRARISGNSSKWLLAGALAGAFALSSSAALAQEAKTTPGESGGTGDYGYKFEDDPLAAGGFGPSDATIRVRPGPVRTTLIRPRTSFVPEMLKSVENI